MGDWQPIGTAPECEEVECLFTDGSIRRAEKLPPAPSIIDPEQTSGGWYVCVEDLDDIGSDFGVPTCWRQIA